jgi:hypothetical protein
MMISRRKSSAYKTADKCVFFLGSMTIGLSYHTSGLAFYKKLKLIFQTLGMQYKMIPHNIAECQWLIAVINRPFLLAQRRAKNSQRMQDKSKNQQKILFTHKKGG